MDILLVDDNVEFLLPMKEALYQHGYTVLAADDGEQACRIMSVTSVDLIISDIEMPHMSGIRLHQTARTMKRYQKTKFVFLTDWKDSYEQDLQLNPERDFFLDKTMAVDQVIKFIDRLLFGKYAEVWV